MSSQEQIIPISSPEAAKPVSVLAWKSANGEIYFDERTARYAGCTHVECAKCKTLMLKGYTVCRDCQEEAEKAKYALLEKRPWTDNTPIYSEAADVWFFSEHELSDYCDENNITPSELRLLHSKPVYFRELDAIDHCEDELPEDGDVPDEILEAFERLNAAIRAYGKPLSYEPSKYAVDL